MSDPAIREANHFRNAPYADASITDASVEPINWKRVAVTLMGLLVLLAVFATGYGVRYAYWHERWHDSALYTIDQKANTIDQKVNGSIANDQLIVNYLSYLIDNKILPPPPGRPGAAPAAVPGSAAVPKR